MTDLAVNQFNSMSVMKTIAALSPGLKSLLSVEPSNHRAVSEIAGNPVLLEECRKALPAIHANATLPAGPDGVTKLVTSLFVMFPQPHRSEPEWSEFWRSYQIILADQPMTALEAAKEAILRDPKVEFLPKPSRILELAKMTPNRAVKAYDRAKAAIEYKPPEERGNLSPEQVKEMIQPIAGRVRLEPTQADKDRVKRLMREYIEQDEARKAKAKTAATAQRHDVSGPVDEAGITPTMRAYLNRRDFQEQEGDWS